MKYSLSGTIVYPRKYSFIKGYVKLKEGLYVLRISFFVKVATEEKINLLCTLRMFFFYKKKKLSRINPV